MYSTRSRWIAAALLACGLLASSWAAARIVRLVPGEDLRAAAADLAPGDVLELESGLHAFDTRQLVHLQGTADAPIILRGAPGGRSVIHMRNPRENVLDVDRSRHLVIRDLVFTGGSHGIRLIDSSDVTIEDCEVFDTGDVAISANARGVYRNLVIRGNTIHHTHGTGEGLYLGCHGGSCRVVDSLIERNHIHSTNGPDVAQGDGIEIKEGSAGNRIRHNVIHDTRYPGILTYATLGNGAPNVIEGNLIWNTTDHAIQSAADAVIRNNVVVGASISLQPHERGRPSNQVVVHNTVIGGTIRVRDASGAVVVANNAVYPDDGSGIDVSGRGIDNVARTGNAWPRAPHASTDARAALDRDFRDPRTENGLPIDLRPSADGTLAGAGDPAFTPDRDFADRDREGRADIGAYRARDDDCIPWRLAPGFMRTCAPSVEREPAAGRTEDDERTVADPETAAHAGVPTGPEAPADANGTARRR